MLLEKGRNAPAERRVALAPVAHPDPANLDRHALSHKRRGDALDKALLPSRVERAKAGTGLRAQDASVKGNPVV